MAFDSALTKKARLYLVRNYSKNLGRSRARFPRAKLRFARARKIGFVSQKKPLDRFLALRLCRFPKTKAWSATVFVDELHASGF
jgi:hypothetical protein